MCVVVFVDLRGNLQAGVSVQRFGKQTSSHDTSCSPPGQSSAARPDCSHQARVSTHTHIHHIHLRLHVDHICMQMFVISLQVGSSHQQLWEVFAGDWVVSEVRSLSVCFCLLSVFQTLSGHLSTIDLSSISVLFLLHFVFDKLYFLLLNHHFQLIFLWELFDILVVNECPCSFPQWASGMIVIHVLLKRKTNMKLVEFAAWWRAVYSWKCLLS